MQAMVMNVDRSETRAMVNSYGRNTEAIVLYTGSYDISDTDI
jgi:hypothetical protein